VDRHRTGRGGTLHAAIDLGAGSGRALVGGVGEAGFGFREVHRFHYAPRLAAGRLRWDAVGLLSGIRAGLRLACNAAAEEGTPVASVGVDSWGVDYALLDGGGNLVEEPICYRDDRTVGAMEQVFAVVPRDEIFARTGIQFQVFNTLY
jgi:rhamnulokinase